MMSQSSKRELLAVLRARYRKADRSEKGRILDELVATTGFHRRYAIQILNHPPSGPDGRRRTSPRKYTWEVIVALEQLWRIGNRMCGKRLVPALPTTAIFVIMLKAWTKS